MVSLVLGQQFFKFSDSFLVFHELSFPFATIQIQSLVEIDGENLVACNMALPDTLKRYAARYGDQILITSTSGWKLLNLFVGAPCVIFFSQ